MLQKHNMHVPMLKKHHMHWKLPKSDASEAMLKKQPFLETSMLKKNKVFGQDQKFQSHDVLKNPQSQDRVKNHGGTRHA